MDTTHTALASIGIDIGEDVFHIVRFGADGKIAFFRATTRGARTKSRTPGSAILVGKRQPHSAGRQLGFGSLAGFWVRAGSSRRQNCRQYDPGVESSTMVAP